MTNSRQIARRREFNVAFARMPLWETWIKREANHSAANPKEWETEFDFRGISRRVRRSMARAYVKRFRRAGKPLSEQ